MCTKRSLLRLTICNYNHRCMLYVSGLFTINVFSKKECNNIVAVFCFVCYSFCHFRHILIICVTSFFCLSVISATSGMFVYHLCHFRHHKLSFVPLLAPQTVICATYGTTNCHLCHFWHHKLSFVPLLAPQTVICATSVWSVISATSAGLFIFHLCDF